MSVPALVISLTITGTGLSMGYLSSKIMLNEYFKGNYVLVAAIANLGNTTGALIAPYIVERSLEAYGYVGAMLILGGISLHAIPASVALRNPPETPIRSSNPERETEALILDEERSSKRYLRKTRQPTNSNFMITEDNQQNRPPVSLGSHDNTIKQKFKNLVQSCICIQEPLMTISSPSIFLTFFGVNSWVLFLVPRAEWHGIPSSDAVFLSTLAGAGGIIGRLVYIALIYFGANAIFLSFIFNMISAITFLMDPLITTFPEMCVVAFIQGWCLFSCQVSTAAYPKYAASDKNFALAAGLQGLMAGMGAIVGGFISGLIKDASRSFTIVFLVLGAVFTVNSMTTLLFFVAYRRKRAMPSPRGD
ncbi:monocarboxylate transporter 3-like [Strongylocentrotus purpuratus]|uniref:Uncharacterized protein n=1 Tax=Strongylocentrotus purpuratus TaxID=7668 RepID=A0A7M7N4X6_STRPU|nr:monocarboxylate transporter 3-like [Strongylocentrotus purpuratus]